MTHIFLINSVGNNAMCWQERFNLINDDIERGVSLR